MRWAVRIGCLIPFATSIGLMVWYWPGALPEDNASGVWTALAQDFARGVFYRPTADGFGFGGTRYMPLFFMMHAGLIRLSLDPVAAGLVLMLVSVALFDAATLLALRELGLEWSLVLPLAVLAHATVSLQVLTLQVKGDVLAAAFVMWGVYFALRLARRARAADLAAVVLLLLAAFLTKFTALAAGLGIAAWLYWIGRRRAALMVSGGLLGLAALASGVMDWASDGRAWDSFTAVAAGGARPFYALGAPLWFVKSAVQDPVFVVVSAVAGWIAVCNARERRLSFPVLYFLYTVASTIAIFASPGTDTNHFMDLLGAATLLVGAEIGAQAKWTRLAAYLPAGLAVLTIVSLVPGMISVKSVIERNGKPERWETGVIAARLGPDAHDLLSENPIVPIVLGQRPRVLDPFNLRLIASERPEVARDFARRMSNGSFGAVILVDFSASDRRHLPAALDSCTASDGARCYGEVSFPPGFLHLLEREYVLSFIEKPFVVYQRRARH